MEKKTHRLVKEPSINVRYLADFMAASEQRRRGILQNSKYRSTARMIQHIDAKLVVTNFILSGGLNPDGLLERADQIENKLSTDQFEADVNKHNASYIRRFYKSLTDGTLPSYLIQQGGAPIDIPIEGVRVRFDPPIRLTRMTKTNKAKCGAMMLRYQKDKPLAENVAEHQSAIMLGLLKIIHDKDVEEPEGKMCLTLDAQVGVCHPAPGNAIYLFNEAKAACASIAERWAAIKSPKNAIF